MFKPISKGLLFFLGLFMLTGGIILDINKDDLKCFSESEVSEVLALYDHDAKLVLYKDVTVPACFIQRLWDDGKELDTRKIILTGKPLVDGKGWGITSKFHKEFCSNLPVYEMELGKMEPRRRVHRSRRGKRNVNTEYVGSDDNLGRGHRSGSTQQHQFYWPGSQTQVQGNVAGNGHFSGQAQSAYSGLSQSQIQLGGVGLTGSISSVAGGAQSALRLGTRSGSGQISSSGHGQSASELQLNLGEQGQQSSGRAMVMQQHQSGQQSSLLMGQSGQSKQLQGFGLTKQHQEDSRMLQQSSRSASAGFGQGQGGSSYRQYSGGDMTSDIQAPPRERIGQNVHFGGNGFQSLPTGGERQSESGGSNYGESHQRYGQGQGLGRSTLTETSSNRYDGQGRDFQGAMTPIDTSRNLEGHDLSRTTRVEGRGRSYQQTPIQQPQDFTHGSGFHGQFRSDSVNIKDFPGMMPAPVIDQYGSSGHQGQQSTQTHQSEQRYYAQQQPRTDTSQTGTGTGFRMRTETFGTQKYPLPSRQGGGARVESTQEETLTTTHTQHPPQPQYSPPQNRISSTRVVQETQTHGDVFPPAPVHQRNPQSQNGHTTQKEHSETETSLQHQSAQFGSPRPELSQPTRAHQQTYDSSLTAHRTYTQQQGDLPMMTSYPIPNGRRVYQRRIVTYYPGQMTQMNLQPHYVQQSMTGMSGRASQPIPQHFGMGEPQGPTGHPGETGRCHTVTFQCTVIFDTNGKSKLCQPKPANGNGHSNICCC